MLRDDFTKRLNVLIAKRLEELEDEESKAFSEWWAELREIIDSEVEDYDDVDDEIDEEADA